MPLREIPKFERTSAITAEMFFDPYDRDHMSAVLSLLRELGSGSGWKFESFFWENNEVWVRREILPAALDPQERTWREVPLPYDVTSKPLRDVAWELETDPRYTGYFVTEFPEHMTTAVMTRLSHPEENRLTTEAFTSDVETWETSLAARWNREGKRL